MDIKKIAGFALGPIGGALLGFITLPIISWYFSVEDVGRISYLNIVIAFSVVIFSLGLDQSYVRFFHSCDQKKILFKISVLPGLALLLIIVILLLADNFIAKKILEIDSFILSLSIVLIILFSFLSRFFSLILRMNERGLAYSLSQIFPKFILLILLINIIFLDAEKNIYSLVLINLVSVSTVFFFLAWNTKKYWYSKKKEVIQFALFKEIFVYGFPLIFSGVVFWLLIATDKIILKELTNFKELGIYSVAISFATVATVLQSVFSTVWAPIVYKWANDRIDIKKIIKIQEYMLMIVILVFCFAGMFSWVIAYILPKDYDLVQWILIPCLGYPLLYTLSETTVIGINLVKKTKFILLSTLIAFLINLGLAFSLIPKFGAAGAAVSTCISFWCFFVLRTEFSNAIWNKVPTNDMYSWSTLLVLLSIATVFYGPEYSFYIQMCWFFVFIFYIIYFRKNILKVYKYFKSKL